MTERFFLKSVTETRKAKKEDLHQSVQSAAIGPWSGAAQLRKNTATESSANLIMQCPS